MKFDHNAHVRLWGWAALHPNRHPLDWPEWERNGGTVQPGNPYSKAEINSIAAAIFEFLETDDPKEKRRMALQIRDLPLAAFK